MNVYNPYGYGQYTQNYGQYGYGQQYPNGQNQQQTAPSPMSPPTVHVDIIQVKTAEEVTGYPVNAGTTQMFQLADDSAFITKTVYADGQTNIDIYPKQPKKPAPPPFDPSQFVTWDALEEKLAGLQKRRGRKDEADAGQES